MIEKSMVSFRNADTKLLYKTVSNPIKPLLTMRFNILAPILVVTSVVTGVVMGQGPNIYYRLTNSFNGPSLALDVANATSGELKIATAGDFSGQYWRLVPAPENPAKFRLQTLFLGPGRSLDVVNDGANTKLVLSPTAFVSGQFWTLTKVDPQATFFKLSNDFTGPSKFLDVFR